MKLADLQEQVAKAIKDKGLKRPNKVTRYNLALAILKKS